jgi:hypothetical protein
MITVFQLLAVLWAPAAIYGLVHVFIPYTLDRFEEARWQRLHPGMPSWRRVSQ